jgi:hypothetical protein
MSDSGVQAVGGNSQTERRLGQADGDVACGGGIIDVQKIRRARNHDEAVERSAVSGGNRTVRERLELSLADIERTR